MPIVLQRAVRQGLRHGHHPAVPAAHHGHHHRLAHRAAAAATMIVLDRKRSKFFIYWQAREGDSSLPDRNMRRIHCKYR